MKKSTHRVEIVKLNPERHPNADSLVVQRVYGYQVCLRASDWEGRSYGAYLQPDSVVDTDRPEFNWLKGPNFRNAIDNDETNTRFHKVCAMRLRGVLSYGLMVDAPLGSKPGDDVSDLLGVTRYHPTILSDGEIPGPEGYAKDYDLEAYERYASELFRPGEMVYCFEKLDGVNSRYKFEQEKMFAGSRSIWLEEKAESTWWKNLSQFPNLAKMCRELGLVPYGEIVGYPKGHNTKKRYAIKPGEIDYFLFDLLDGDQFLSWDKVRKITDEYQIKTAPLVAEMPYDFEKVLQLADGMSLVPGANHAREGIVVRPMEERRDLAGRAVLKLVSAKTLIG